jgi:hypothetical protein
MFICAKIVDKMKKAILHLEVRCQSVITVVPCSPHLYPLYSPAGAPEFQCVHFGQQNTLEYHRPEYKTNVNHVK